MSGLFDRMSASYERMNYVLSFGFSARWRRQLVGLIDHPAEARDVIDLMSGMGETWAIVSKTFPGASLSALDFSPRMVEHAATRNDRKHGGAFTLRCEDILAGSLPEAGFDVIVCALGLKTFDRGQSVQLAEEVSRILRPGGQFAFIEVTEPPNRLLRFAYDFYLSRVVPVIGSLLISDPTEYRMLFRYLREFGSGERAAAAFAHPGLSTTRRSHFFGCATSFSGIRLA